MANPVPIPNDTSSIKKHTNRRFVLPDTPNTRHADNLALIARSSGTCQSFGETTKKDIEDIVQSSESTVNSLSDFIRNYQEIAQRSVLLSNTELYVKQALYWDVVFCDEFMCYLIDVCNVQLETIFKWDISKQAMESLCNLFLSKHMARLLKEKILDKTLKKIHDNDIHLLSLSACGLCNFRILPETFNYLLHLKQLDLTGAVYFTQVASKKIVSLFKQINAKRERELQKQEWKREREQQEELADDWQDILVCESTIVESNMVELHITKTPENTTFDCVKAFNCIVVEHLPVLTLDDSDDDRGYDEDDRVLWQYMVM